MHTPVIIPARNEAKHIGNGLEALSRQSIDLKPIVIVNGSVDQTADISRQFGATVLESEEGKMRALQTGLRFLGKRALNPVLILDGDSRPLSRKWGQKLIGETNKLPKEKPALVWGPYVFAEDISLPLGIFFTATSMYVSWTDRREPAPRTIRGGNTSLRIKNYDLLDELMGMDNYWPREDVAIHDAAVKQGANKLVVLGPEAWVITSGARLNDALKRLIKKRENPNAIYDQLYAGDAPAMSSPYNGDKG